MLKPRRNPDRRMVAPPGDKWECGRKLAKLQGEMSAAGFTRLLNEQSWSLGASPATLRRYVGDTRALDSAIPNKVARDALLEVTGNGRGLVRTVEGDLSPKYVAALLKFPVPAVGTSYEDCHDWALEVMTAASHHTDAKDDADSWQVQTAKARFSEVFRRARAEGPQRIRRQGKDGVVMIAEEQYDQLMGRSHQPTKLVEFFRKSPLVGVDLDLDRDRAPARDIEL